METDAAGTDEETADPEETAHEAYFRELNDGCGCTEIWEYLSDRRREARE